MKKFLVAIDQGTTSSRVILFDVRGNIKFISQFEFKQYFPQNGWVEHNPNEIWLTTLKALKKVIKKASTLNGKIISLGITNQRETTILWNKKTGKVIYNAIVWQDRRTEKYCEKLKKKNYEKKFRKKTGLFIDPYFSAKKIKWIYFLRFFLAPLFFAFPPNSSANFDIRFFSFSSSRFAILSAFLFSFFLFLTASRFLSAGRLSFQPNENQ